MILWCCVDNAAVDFIWMADMLALMFPVRLIIYSSNEGFFYSIFIRAVWFPYSSIIIDKKSHNTVTQTNPLLKKSSLLILSVDLIRQLTDRIMGSDGYTQLIQQNVRLIKSTYIWLVFFILFQLLRSNICFFYDTTYMLPGYISKWK